MADEVEAPFMTHAERKDLTFALRSIADVTQIEIARRLGVSDSTVSRFVAAELPRAIAILCAADIKLVPANCQVYEPRRIQMLLELSRDYLNQLETPEQLQWD